MTEIQNMPERSIASSNGNATADATMMALIDDDAYLMSMVVDTDSLLPSNLTFTGLFDGDGELNAEELTDIASLLAPQVSDDDETTGGAASVSSSEANTPTNTRTMTSMITATNSTTFGGTTSTSTMTVGEIPILPKLTHKDLAAPATLSPKKRTLAAASATKASAPKKTKTTPAKKTATTKAKQPTTAAPLAAAPSATPDPLAASRGKAPETTTTITSVSTADNKAVSNDKNVSADTSTKKSTEIATTTTTTKHTATETVWVLETNDKYTTTAATATTNTKSGEFHSSDDASVVTDTASDTNAAVATDSNGKVLTEEERAKQCRDRNRQHARNTRLRKKAYVEELKKQLRDMVEARDAALLEETQKTKIAEQQREVRFQVMQDFLQLRGRNEGNPHRWAAILEEGFTLTMPVTQFQTMVESTSTVTSDNVPTVFDKTEQILHGVPDIMADSTYFASFLQSLGETSSASDNTTTTTHCTTTTNDDNGDDTNIPVTFVYHCDRKNFMMDGCNAILNWTANSSGAVRQGAKQELELCGSMRARFCPQTNRLEQVQIQFDTGAVQRQLYQ